MNLYGNQVKTPLYEKTTTWEGNSRPNAEGDVGFFDDDGVERRGWDAAKMHSMGWSGEFVGTLLTKRKYCESAEG